MRKNKLVSIILMEIVPDLKYVTVSIFPQGRFKNWAAIYKKYGILGFTKKTKNSSYSKEFKMELVEKCISGEASSIDLGHQYFFRTFKKVD